MNDLQNLKRKTDAMWRSQPYEVLARLLVEWLVPDSEVRGVYVHSPEQCNVYLEDATRYRFDGSGDGMRAELEPDAAANHSLLETFREGGFEVDRDKAVLVPMD